MWIRIFVQLLYFTITNEKLFCDLTCLYNSYSQVIWLQSPIFLAFIRLNNSFSGCTIKFNRRPLITLNLVSCVKFYTLAYKTVPFHTIWVFYLIYLVQISGKLIIIKGKCVMAVYKYFYCYIRLLVGMEWFSSNIITSTTLLFGGLLYFILQTTLYFT